MPTRTARAIGAAIAAATLFGVTAPSSALGAECRQTLDDFNRPDSTNLGADWTEQVGDFALSNGRADHSAGGFGLMTFNGGPTAPGAVCADIDQGFYAGIVLRYASTSDNYFIKFQDGSGDGTPDRVFFYLGNQTGSGATPGVHFITPFTSARVYASVSGTTATVQIDSNFDGTTDETFSSTYGTGTGNGTGYGVVGFSGGQVDNFGVENLAPAITPSGTALSWTEGDPATPVDPALTTLDAEEADLDSADVRITSGFQPGDALSFVDQNGITGSYDAATGVLSLTGTATVANYQDAFRSVAYRHVGVAPSANKTVAFRADDGFGDSAPVTRAITVTAVDNAPALTTSSGTVPYTQNDPATVVDPGATAADTDDANLESARVRIATGFQPGDLLTFADQNGIAGAYDAAAGVLSLTGSATVANYQAALRSVEFQHPGVDLVTRSKSVEFRVSDGDLDSNSPTRSIATTGIDDPPVITIYDPPPPVSGPAPAPVVPEPPQPAPTPRLVIISHTNVVTSARGALITLRCTGATGAVCSGTVELQATRLLSRLQVAGVQGVRRKFSFVVGGRQDMRVAVPTASRVRLSANGKAVARAVVRLPDGSVLKRLVSLYTPR